jgi:hypothetical protein
MPTQVQHNRVQLTPKKPLGTGGDGTGGLPGVPPTPPIHPAVMVRLGKRFLVPYTALIAGYITLAFLAQSLLPMAIGLRFGDLTHAVAARSSSQSLVGLYWFWIGLTIASIAASFGQRILTSYMDGSAKRLTPL